MTGDKVKLMGFWASPFVFRVKLALSLKGIEYEYVEEDISNKSPMLLQLNPVHKKVPVLVHNGKPILESLVIIEYIDEIWKDRPLLPEDPIERARSRFWAKFVDDKFVPMIIRVLRGTQDEKEEAAKEGREILKTLETTLNPNNTVSRGESLGFKDIAIAWLGIWGQVFEKIMNVKLFNEDNTPLLNMWYSDLLNVHVVKECIPPIDKLLAHYQAFHDKLIAARNLKPKHV
ncbi:glutathione transferase GST 23-like protein [Tanacetum coccineum]